MLTRFDRRVVVAVLVLIVIVAVTALIALRQGERGARVAYLAPSRAPFNIYLADPAYPDEPVEQLTLSEWGVYDFDISRGGRYIAYSEDQPDNETRELMLLDLANNSTRALTTCAAENALCTNPVWRPDGSVIAYQRTDFGEPRIWLLEIESARTFPLFEQPEVLGTDPRWSPDGSRLAFYDNATQTVLVYNFNAASEQTRISALRFGNGSSGAFAPDSAHIVFPELLISSPARAVMRLANLDTGSFQPLTPEEEFADDGYAVYHPDGRRVVLTRAYLDERFTEGDQVYMVDTLSNTVQPLIFDADYQHNAPIFNPDGTMLALHRFSFERNVPEIWVYSMETQVLTRIAEEGFYPRWLN
jgi:Tol biopolymer transport system component